MDDLGDEGDGQLPDPHQDDDFDDNELPIQNTDSSKNVANNEIDKPINQSFQADKRKMIDPPTTPKTAKKRKKRKRPLKGRSKGKSETLKADTPKQPQVEEPAKPRYKLRNRPKEGDSSEDEEEIKSKKQVSFEDGEPQSKKPLRIEYNEPIDEIEDMI